MEDLYAEWPDMDDGAVAKSHSFGMRHMGQSPNSTGDAGSA